MDLDEIYDKIGSDLGRKQRAYIGACSLAQFVGAFQMVYLVFAGDVPKFACNGEKISTEDYSATEQCRKLTEGKCGKFEYISSNWITYPQEANLICDQAYRISFLQSVYMGGVLVGSLVFGIISDRIGRLLSIYISSATIGLAAFLLGFSQSFRAFAVLRFLIGFGIAGHGIATYVLGSELVGGSWRTLYSIGTNAAFAAGIIVLSGLAFMVDNWRSFSHLCAAACFACFSTYLILPESPRWLLSQGEYSKALRIVHSIARGNGLSDKHIEQLDVSKRMSKKDLNVHVGEHAVGLRVIFEHPTLLKWTSIQVYSWFANLCVYYGLTLATPSLSSNLFISVILSGLAEMPAYAAMVMMHRKMRRKTLVGRCMIMGGFSCMCILFLSQMRAAPGIRTMLALVGKMGISASFSGVYMHTSELFPTSIRSGGLGLCSTSALIGGILAPYISLVGNYYPSQEFFIFGLIGMSAGLLNLYLPETMGRPLPDIIADVLSLQQSSSFSGVEKKPKQSKQSTDLQSLEQMEQFLSS